MLKQVLFLFLFLPALTLAQSRPPAGEAAPAGTPGRDRSPGDTSAVKLNEVVVAASKFTEDKRRLPYQIDAVTRPQLEFRNQSNSADVLLNTGNVFVQKSQGGGGSPVLRGFEASRVLIVVDGVRLNNAIYRAGHLQNVLRIDPSVLDRAEVLFGPGSIIYGSDALGGVMHFRTRTPELSQNGGWTVQPSAYVRYASAAHEQTGHVNVSFGHRRWAFLSSVTHANFGDIRAGNIRPRGFPDFGKQFQYVVREGEQDVVRQNPDPDRQIGTGYRQLDLLQKVLFQPREGVQHVLNLQYSTTGNVPRYDRLSEIDSGRRLPRWAEWYYGPEIRSLASYQLTLTKNKTWFDRAMVTAAYQLIEESRYSRRRGNNNRLGQVERVGVWSLNADVQKSLGRHLLQYGLELTHNTVASAATSTNVATGVATPASTRYPDGGSAVSTLGLYLTDQFSITDKLILNGGLRYAASRLNATFQDRTFFPFPFDNITQTPSAMSGNLGLTYLPTRQTKLSLLGSTSFRAPNVDDLAKVFESTAGRLVVPNPNIRPEYTYNAEVSVSHQFGGRLRVEGTYFYTFFDNAIVVSGFTFNGQRQLLFNGVLSNVVAAQNSRAARVSGYNLGATLTLTDRLSLTSTYNDTRGRIRDERNTPLDHIPPTFGRTSLLYRGPRLQLEAFALYNGWKRIAEFSPDGEDNLQYATPDGMPAWTTVNLRGAYRLAQSRRGSVLTAQAALENIFDRHVRYFASGVSAPGRNLILTLRATL